MKAYRTSEIKNLIHSHEDGFIDYLRVYLIDDDLFRVLEHLSESVDVFILSGIIRDYFLGRYGMSRDLDFVLRQPVSLSGEMKRFLHNHDISFRLNSFKGLKISNESGPDIDIWLLGQTWGIKRKNILNPTPNALLDTVFFNFSAILYDFRRHKFIYNDAFVNFIQSRTIDIVYEDNPNVTLCLFNIYYYSTRLNLRISPKVKRWIKRHYTSDIDFDCVQQKHLGEIKYKQTDIESFLKANTNMTYGIDWSKYLSTDRLKPSEKELTGNGVDKRTPFESDFGRVVFSSAVRRMHDKTQVIPLTSGDNIHTRLTHSLEVMNTAQSLAVNLCRDKDFIDEYGIEEAYRLERNISAILKTAGFVHDIGNPPFGHFGETVIQNYFKEYLDHHILCERFRPDYDEFDGNAQGFRILTRLSYIGYLSGLNLTYATLGAYLKYPNAERKTKGKYIGLKKHGVYATEEDILNKIADSCNMRREDNSIKRHPLSFLVEAADSICYNVMDIEDGYLQHWYDHKQIIEFLNQEITGLIKATGHRYPEYFIDGKPEHYSFMKIIYRNPRYDDNEIDRKWNHAHWIMNMRVALIQYLVELASANFKLNASAIDAGDYSKELIDDDPYCVSAALQKFTRRYIFPKREIQKAELTGHSVIRGLLDILLQYVSSSDQQFRQRVKSIVSRSALRVAYHESKEEEVRKGLLYISDDDLFGLDVATLSENAKLRLVVDFVSGMTDKFAVQLYQELSGQKI